MFNKITIFTAFYLFLCLSVFGQFLGGNGSGHSSIIKINSSCNITDANPFTGGIGSGSVITMVTFSPCSIVDANPFTGGVGSGYVVKVVSTSPCSIVSANPFTGGNGSGYVLNSVTSAPCSIVSANPFTGGGGSGYVLNSVTMSPCFIVSANPFIGGSGSGYVLNAITSSPCSIITANPFIGGVGSGYVINTLTSSPCSINAANPFTGGHGSGFNIKGFYPIAIGGVVSSNQSICSGMQPMDVSVSGYFGSVSKWQMSSNASFSSSTNIGSTSPTLTSALIGAILSPTYIRAEIKLSTCSTAYSSPVLISTGSSTSWNGSVWSNGTPDITKGIILNSNYTSNTDISGCTMNVTNNANVIINSGTNVNLFGALTVDSGSTFTLNNNSNLLQVTDVQNIGNIVVKRNTSPLFRLDYDTWSSPVSGTQSLTNFSPLTTSNRFYTYDTTTNLYNSIADPSTTTFTKGKGYLIRTPNNWVSYSATATPAPWTGIFNGVPNNGPISVPLVDGGSTDTRYNAVGNPYPSTIKISDFINANSSAIDGTLWFWRKTNDASNQVSYSTCSNAGCTLNNGFNFYTNFNFISPGQGFIVHSKANQNNLNFTNAIRYADNTNQFFKTNQNNIDRFWLELKNSANASFGQFLMAYLPGATVNYDDGLDGLYINDSQTILSAIVDNKELVIEARPSFDVQDVAPLQFRTNNADTYTISLHSTEGVFSTNQDIFIRDNQTGSVQNLKEDNYTFVSNNGVYPGRFDLLYQNTLLSVNSQTINDDAITIYKSNETIYIDSANFLMSNVKIFDIRGRLLIEKLKINDTKLSIDTAIYGNQMLLVQITLDGGNIIYKKVMN
ncbi:T9SS sorting signal type C domain-containing protein [Flavobacterium sp. SUN046]|uniref:T9SS sorting signal type C domain-containing protein n=1 Tax=Flavobacterium sp. SUN046 TaxID=3002440 RepID=UPI002DB55940|nr:T9SS sorting signal type C domain-containing protein [Flavobacterium sp. SUN046]MEC4050479.1 T9SS sorting signal type C domain-containing protein [Flavobacterium sp. SUN046]